MLYTETQKPYDVGIYERGGNGEPLNFRGFDYALDAHKYAREATPKGSPFYAIVRDNTGTKTGRYRFDHYENGAASYNV